MRSLVSKMTLLERYTYERTEDDIRTVLSEVRDLLQRSMAEKRRNRLSSCIYYLAEAFELLEEIDSCLDQLSRLETRVSLREGDRDA